MGGADRHEPVAARLYAAVAQRFEAFLDAQRIKPGYDWRGERDGAPERMGVLLLIVSPNWNAAPLANEMDEVRAELLAALEAGIPIIPILLAGATLPPEAVSWMKRTHPLLQKEAKKWQSGQMQHKMVVQRR